MFNRSQIMTRAWQIYRDELATWGRVRFPFGEYLGRAWREAKFERIAADPRALRAHAIRYELATLSTRSFQQNIEPLRGKLEDEVASLAA